MDFSGSSDSKEFTCNTGNLGSVPELRRSLEEGMATHSSILVWRIPMGRGAWWPTVQGVAELDMTEQLSTAHSHSNIVKTVSWGLKWYIPLFPYHLLQNQSATINVQLQKYNLQGLEKNQPRGIKICLQLFTWTALPNETFINQGLISTENLHVFKCLFVFYPLVYLPKRHLLLFFI